MKKDVCEQKKHKPVAAIIDHFQSCCLFKAYPISKLVPNAVQRLCARAGCPPLYIDCGNLACQRAIGVSHVVSQLLWLHRAGARSWLRNANAPLRHYQRLQLTLGAMGYLSRKKNSR